MKIEVPEGSSLFIWITPGNVTPIIAATYEEAYRRAIENRAKSLDGDLECAKFWFEENDQLVEVDTEPL